MLLRSMSWCVCAITDLKWRRGHCVTNGVAHPICSQEMNTVVVLASMEAIGVGFNGEVLHEAETGMQKQLDELVAQSEQQAGRSFLITSPHEVVCVGGRKTRVDTGACVSHHPTTQVSKLLFEELKLKPPSWSTVSAKGHRGTGDDVLQDLRYSTKAVLHLSLAATAHVTTCS